MSELTERGVDVPASRLRMLELLRRHIRDERVIEAFASVDRELFVPRDLRAAAYDDGALPIGDGQTISQPLMVALQVAAAQIVPTDRVLEVGTGSGYQAAILSRLAMEVVTVERVPRFLARARAALDAANISNVSVGAAGDVLGAPARGPFDAVIVAAGGPHVPRALLGQLAPAGRLVMPVGSRREQQLVRATLLPHGLSLERLGPCAFVPLVGEQAWQGDAAGGFE